MFPGSPCCTQTETNGNINTFSHLVFLLAQFQSFAQNYQQVAGTCWSFCADGLFVAPYNVSQGQGEKEKEMIIISFGSRNE